MFEQEQITWEEFVTLYYNEMGTTLAKGEIKWIKDFSKNNDVVLLCYEKESDSSMSSIYVKRA